MPNNLPVVVFLILTAVSSQAEVLTITSWGGEYAAAQRRAFFDPFTSETGHRIIEDKWGGDIARIRAMVARNHYTSTVFDAEEDQVHEGCNEGILEEIDYTRLNFSKDKLLPGAAHNCGVGSLAWSMVFAYDPSQVGKKIPKSWQDFWDTEKFPGKRGLYRGLETNLEIALLADGVSADKVYDELARPEGRARAFKKLDALRPNIVWWQAGAQAAQLLLDREVVMTSGWNGRLHRVSTPERPFPVVWSGQLMFFEYWIIPKGHPQRQVGYDFIAFATRAERQVEMSRFIPYGPLNKEWIKFADPSGVARSPTAPSHLLGALKVQPGYWTQHSNQLEEVFTQWLNE